MQDQQGCVPAVIVEQRLDGRRDATLQLRDALPANKARITGDTWRIQSKQRLRQIDCCDVLDRAIAHLAQRFDLSRLAGNSGRREHPFRRLYRAWQIAR
jgi:hypothetical protein